MDTHLAWDRNILTMLFGMNKSGRIRTECGKTVNRDKIDPTGNQPTCQKCAKILKSEKEISAFMKIDFSA